MTGVDQGTNTVGRGGLLLYWENKLDALTVIYLHYRLSLEVFYIGPIVLKYQCYTKEVTQVRHLLSLSRVL